MQGYEIVERWAEHFNESDAKATAALYAPGATLWGTLAQALTASPEGIQTYFANAARAGLKVKLGEHISSRLSETCLVECGAYELSRSVDGQTAVFPARYSFVLTKQDGGWLIAHHHSSILPRPLDG